MCEIQDILQRPALPLRMDDKLVPLPVEKMSIPAPRVIKISATSSPVGTVVTVCLEPVLFNPFVPKLMFNGAMLQTKCLQSNITTSLMAVLPHQLEQLSSVAPLYVCLCANDGMAMAWHLTNFVLDHSRKLLDSALLEHLSPPFYQCLPAAIYSERFEPVGYQSRLPSISDTSSLCNDVPSPNSGFTAFLKDDLRPVRGGETPQQHRRHMPSSPAPPCLYILGDLDSMTEDWTPAERRTQRRIVQFNRTKINDQQTHCAFRPTTPTNAMDGEVVSCIYWPENDNWYFTSVECLKLLEYLMDRRFSVDEKNRVRRNLEGFRPLTLAKTKSKGADFFKRIMAYPPPKPRNIEKDLKVFPWKVLALAVKKISVKYGFKRAESSSPLA